MEIHLMKKDPRNFRIDPLICELFTVQMRNKIQNCMGIEEQIMKCASFYITRWQTTWKMKGKMKREHKHMDNGLHKLNNEHQCISLFV